MKKILTVIMLLVAMNVAAQKEIKVNSARELIEAIGSNRIIVIQDGCVLNLTPILNNEDFFDRDGFGWLPNYYPERNGTEELKVSCKCFDGRMLDLIGIRNLTIRGGKDCKIVVEPRYAYIFSFYGCKNIRLERLTIGHTEEGYCEGGVILASGCENLSIANCDLYGCGTYGLETASCRNVTMEKSIIRDCSYGIMQISNSSECKFIDCDFFRCREFNLVTLSDSEDALFRNCRFAQNQGELFMLESATRFENCEIHHAEDQEIGNVDSENFIADKATKVFRDDAQLKERKIGPKYAPERLGNTSSKEIIEAIRKRYAEVKEMQKLRKEAELPPNQTVVTSNYMAAGAGPVNDVTTYFYLGDYDEDLNRQIYAVNFIVRKYNVGATEFYQEFLFDEDGILIFYFEKSDKDETRYYWGYNELVKEDVKGECLTDEVNAYRLSQELLNAFNLLMNREF